MPSFSFSALCLRWMSAGVLTSGKTWANNKDGYPVIINRNKKITRYFMLFFNDLKSGILLNCPRNANTFRSLVVFQQSCDYPW